MFFYCWGKCKLIWYCTHYVCYPDFFIFFVVVFECISSNIVKRDMALSSDEVWIVFFLYTLSLFSRNFKPRLVMPKFQASISVYRAAKLPPLQPAPCYPEILRYLFVSLCSENSLHLNPRLAIPKLQRARKLPPPAKSRHAKCPWYPWTERTA